MTTVALGPLAGYRRNRRRPRPGDRRPAFAATDPNPSSRSTLEAGPVRHHVGRRAVPPPHVFDIPIAGSLLSTGMSEIAQAIADRQSEIDRLQAEIKALTDVEQILGASAPAARSTSRRSSSPTKAAAAADSTSETKPARKRREMFGRGEEGGIGAHDRLLGRTEEEGRQEVGAPPTLKPPAAAPRRSAGRRWTRPPRRPHQ